MTHSSPVSPASRCAFRMETGVSITALAGTAGETGPLMKNLALFGGLLQIAAASPAGATVRAHVERTGATEES